MKLCENVILLYHLYTVNDNPHMSYCIHRHLMRDSLRVVLLSSFVCVFLQFPFFIVLLMEIFCQRDTSNSHEPCGQSESTWTAVAAMTMLKPGVMPLTWLAYTDIRNGFRLRNWVLWSGKRRQDENSDVHFNNAQRLHRAVATSTM